MSGSHKYIFRRFFFSSSNVPVDIELCHLAGTFAHHSPLSLPLPRAYKASTLITSSRPSGQSILDGAYMAHIADFLVDTPSSAGLNNYIARELSPHSSHDAVRPPTS